MLVESVGNIFWFINYINYQLYLRGKYDYEGKGEEELECSEKTMIMRREELPELVLSKGEG